MYMLATTIRLRTPLLFVGQTKTFKAIGKSFFRVRNVYLSGAPYQNTTFFNPFSGVPNLSADYPGFSAIRLPNSVYTTNGNNLTLFSVPTASQNGFVDLIIENPAGYGKLTHYVIKSTLNPYPSSLNEHNTYVPYRKPWQDGIKVITNPNS